MQLARDTGCLLVQTAKVLCFGGTTRLWGDDPAICQQFANVLPANLLPLQNADTLPLHASLTRPFYRLLPISTQAREVHQFCTLVGYGADAICPYLAYESLFALHETGKLPATMSREDIVQKYIK